MNNQRGAVLVWMTLMIVLLMIMVGVGLDTGQLTYTRNQGQSAVDAAALSAVSGLPSRNATEVTSRATTFNNKNDYIASATNGIKSSDVSYVFYNHTTNTIDRYNEPIATANGVRVARESDHPITTPVFLTPLMNLLGLATAGTQKVNVSAVATITTVPSIPITIWSSVCGANGVEVDNVVLKVQHPSQKQDDGSENSCWTTFLDCSSGASDIKALFTDSDSCSGIQTSGVSIGTPICQNRGQVNTSLQTPQDFFITEHPNSWWLVPVIGGGANCDPTNPTKVVNWAKIYPTKVDTTGNPKYIQANIVCDPTLIDSVIDTNLCFSHRLVREPSKGY